MTGSIPTKASRCEVGREKSEAAALSLTWVVPANAKRVILHA
ncbi:MAG: hypothetical protein WBD13_01025 [Burkholderiaceae bacterium]